MLRVDGVLRIEGFHDGDLGIRLTHLPAVDPQMPQASTHYIGDRVRLPDTPYSADAFGNRLFDGPSQEVADGFVGAPGNTLLETRLGDGCRLDLNIKELASRQPFAEIEIEEFYLPRIPRTHGYVYRGVARKSRA